MSEPEAGISENPSNAIDAILEQMRSSSPPVPDAVPDAGSAPGEPPPDAPRKRGRPKGSGKKKPAADAEEADNSPLLALLNTQVGAAMLAHAYGLPYTITAGITGMPDEVLNEAVPPSRLMQGGEALRVVIQAYFPQIAKYLPAVMLASCYAIDGVAFYRANRDWKSSKEGKGKPAGGILGAAASAVTNAMTDPVNPSGASGDGPPTGQG